MRILVIDDEPTLLLTLSHDLKSRGWDVSQAANCSDALTLAKEQAPEAVILDVRLPDGSGLELLRKLKTLNPSCTVIMLTAWGNIPSAVEAMKLGADHYLTKPADLEEIALLIGKAEKTQTLRRETEFLRHKAGSVKLVGASKVIATLRSHIELVADQADTTVLIEGESGTGKELVAREIHRHSQRGAGPFIDINCAGLGTALLESELFGHERGAFTDAKVRKSGLFELANRGTLFLDEIGEMELAVQAKLLRVLENRSFRRLGGTVEIGVDVRVVAATNRQLQNLVKEGAFRADLFYRLNVFPIVVPPLRERRGDIPLLAEFFLQSLGVSMHKPAYVLSPEAAALLAAYSWPGNIRELRNVIERAMILARGSVIGPEHLPAEHASAAGSVGRAPCDATGDQRLTLDEIERRHILRVLDAEHGNISATARTLEISRSTLLLKLRKFGVVEISPA